VEELYALLQMRLFLVILPAVQWIVWLVNGLAGVRALLHAMAVNELTLVLSQLNLLVEGLYAPQPLRLVHAILDAVQ